MTELVTGGVTRATDDDAPGGSDNEDNRDPHSPAANGRVGDEGGPESTGKAHGAEDKDKGIAFFALRLDEFNVVCGITCLCKVRCLHEFARSSMCKRGI